MDAIFFSQAKKMFILISINFSKILLYHNMICKKYCLKPTVELVRHPMTPVCVCVCVCVGVIAKVDGDSKYVMGQQSLFPKT